MKTIETIFSLGFIALSLFLLNSMSILAGSGNLISLANKLISILG